MMLFVMVCVLMVQGARAELKEDLQLDASMELYVLVVLGGVTCVAVWEVLKGSLNCIRSYWTAWNKKQKRLERLRERAEAAVDTNYHQANHRGIWNVRED